MISLDKKIILDMCLGTVNLQYSGVKNLLILILWSELCLFVSELNKENEADRTVSVVVVDGI